MTIPNPPFEGACICGAVKVTVTARPLLTVACHCRDCQKLCASAFSITTMFPADSFSCTGELVRGGLSAEPRKHYYCKSCLNFVYSQIQGLEWRVNVRTAMLDQAASLEPFVEVKTAEKVAWASTPAAHSYPDVPSSLEELDGLMKAYARI